MSDGFRVFKYGGLGLSGSVQNPTGVLLSNPISRHFSQRFFGSISIGTKLHSIGHSFCCSESILPYQTHTGCAKILVAAQPGQQTGNQCCLQTIGQSPEVTLCLY